MDVSFWKEIQHLFEKCLDLDPGARSVLLEETSKNNPQLGQEVKNLLESLPKTNTFLEPLVPEQKNPFRELFQQTNQKGGILGIGHQPVPDQIGDYHVERILGTGGMGVVYLAHETSPSRKVAIKVVAPSAPDEIYGPRFKLEMQAQAMMNHRNIASLFHTSETKEKQRYLVMEYIEGQPITVHCDRHGYNLNQRIELFLQVCDGVSHAHNRGVIHGDLKPANILVTEVDGKAEVKLIDFGISRAIDPNLEMLLDNQMEGLLFGSPAYMAPESVDGMDVRADLYALGSIFFELLTGSKMIDAMTYTALSSRDKIAYIRGKVAVRPSDQIMVMKDDLLRIATRRQLSPGAIRQALLHDLDAISLKAMATRPEDRYKAVFALQEDLQRYLDNKVVKANKTTPFKLRLRKFRKRHPVISVAILISSLSFISFVGLGVNAYFKIRAARDEAVLSEEKMARGLDLLRRTQNFYGDLLSMPHPYNKGKDIRFYEVLQEMEKMLPVYARGEPLMEADVRFLLGGIYFSLDILDRAEIELKIALSLKEEYRGEEHVETAEVMARLARCRRSQKHIDEAEQLFRKALAIQEKRLGPNHPESLMSLDGLGTVFSARNNFTEAARIGGIAYRGLDAKLGPDHRQTLSAASNYAIALGKMLRYEYAIELLSSVAKSQARSMGENHPLTALAKSNLANILYDSNRLQEAEILLKDVLVIHQKVLGKDHNTTRKTRGTLASVYLKLGRYEPALQILDELAEAYTQEYGDANHETLKVVNSIATIYLSQGRCEEAVATFEKLLTTFEEAGKSNTRQALNSRQNLAEGLKNCGEYGKALEEIEKTVLLKRKVLKEHHTSTLDSLLTKAEILLYQNKNELALENIIEVLKELETFHANDLTRVHLYKGFKGYALIRTKRTDLGIPLLKDSYKALAGVPFYQAPLENLIKAVGPDVIDPTNL